MRYVRVLGFLLTLTTVFGATGTGASAKLPEWGKCNATASGTDGRYANAGCTEKARKHGGAYAGAYEWQPADGEFSTEPGGVILNGALKFETASGARIECHGTTWSSAATFVVNGAITPLWELTGCTADGEGECATLETGYPPPISNKLERFEEEARGWNHPARLGFIERHSEPEPIVGLGFKEAYNTTTERAEPFFTPISCEQEGKAEDELGTVIIGGDRAGSNGVIGTLGPVDAMSSAYTLTYSESAPGIQSPVRFTHARSQTLRAFIHNAWEPVAFVGQLGLTFTEDWEIKATP